MKLHSFKVIKRKVLDQYQLVIAFTYIRKYQSLDTIQLDLRFYLRSNK